MRVAAAGPTEPVSGLKQEVGVSGEGVWAVAGRESGVYVFVGVESWGAAVAAAVVGGAVGCDACERGWTSPYQAQRGRNGVQRPSAAASDEFAAVDGGMGAASAAAPACGAQRYLHSFPHCHLHVSLLPQLRLC